MITKQNIFIFCSLVFVLFSNNLFAQNEISSWQKLSVPVFSDFKQIQFTSKDTAFIFGKQVVLMETDTCKLFTKQVPDIIDLSFVLPSKTIYTTTTTAYQNSLLFYYNGTSWHQIDNPMANSVSDMFFVDKNNGVMVSYGEVVQLKNGTWSHLNPPTNRSFTKCIQTENSILILSPEKGIFSYNNNNWTLIKNSKSIHSISLQNKTIYALGSDFLGIVKSDTIVKLSKNILWKDIQSITKIADGTIIGAGKKGTIIRYKDGGIQQDSVPVNQDLNYILSHNNSLWCVGDEGTLLKYTNKKIKQNNNQWKAFEKITFKQYAKVIDDEYGVVVADFNNDGWPDIFTCGLFEAEHLYINNKNFVFVDKAQEFKLINKQKSKIQELNLGACAGDIDNDGYIDLYLSILNGKNKIFKNIQGKYFVDYSFNTGGIGEKTDRTNAVIMGDIDNDGDLDIFITNEFSTNRLYLNNGVGIFKEITERAGLITEEGGNGASFSDIDKDGDIDLYVSNWSSENKLYLNQFIESGKVQFIDYTQISQTGGDAYAKSNAVVFSDIDTDGDIDLFVSNRKSTNRLYLNDGNGIFLDKTQSLMGYDKYNSYGVVLADFDGDSFKDIYISNVGKNVFLKNENGKFIDKTIKYGALIKGYSTGSAIADFDKDGDIDIYTANYVGASSALLRNKKNDTQFISIEVKGFINNSSAIGAKIYVYEKTNNKLLWYDEIRAGSGYASSNEFKQTVPIQDNKTVQVKIVYPNGIVKYFPTVSKGSFLKVSDVSGIKKTGIIIKRYLLKYILDPLELYGFIKWIFIILIITLTGLILQKKHNWEPIYPILGGLVLLLFYYVQYTTYKYHPFLFSTLLPLLSILAILLLTYYIFERQYVKRISEIEKTLIKTKLSRDLHDDLSATISSIGFYLTLIKFNTKDKNNKTLELIQKSENLLQNATNSLTDLIWAINPKVETLETLLIRIKKQYQTLFKEKNISFKTPIATPTLKLQLKGNSKQNIFLIIKEALNNILKYAEATEVSIKIRKNKKSIYLTIQDNGKGFEYSKAITKGNGLTNMQKRAKEIGAIITIKSNKEQGTSIEVIFLI